MVLAYIRPDKSFEVASEQLQLINSYAISNDFVVDDEFIDYTSQNKTLDERVHVTDYFQAQAKSNSNSTLLVYDVWVLSTNFKDLVQMVTCLLKNKFKVHFIKQSVIMTQDSNVMLVMGLIDQLRQTLEAESSKAIGRPRGSKSNSKFDKYISEILAYIREKKSVSEISRILGVSRSSLKDYIDSRELKLVALGSLLPTVSDDAEEKVINTIVCPNENNGENE